MALSKYEALTDNDSRQSFLKRFQENGAGHGKESLKFASTFGMSLTHTDETVLGHTEDYYSVGQILAYEGQSLANFPDKAEALSDVKYLVAKNMKLHSWDEADHPPDMDAVKPEYSKFWYVKGKGKETTWKQVEQIQLSGEANLKNAKQLTEGSKFMEGLGFQGELGNAPEVENVKFNLVMKELETVK